MKDFYSVKEFAKLTKIEASTLRFWDEIGLFSPAKRNPENNYRYYSLAQVTAVNFVSVLSELNIPLKEISELRKKRNPEDFMKLLEKQERDMDMELRALRERSSIIHARRELIRYGLSVDDRQVSVLHRDNKALILWPRNEYQEDETFIEPLANFVNQVESYRINLNFPVGGYWDDLQSFQRAPSQPDHFISIDPVGTHVRKAGEYLIGFSRGNYGEMGDLPERMVEHAKKNNLNVSGPLYVMYLLDEICVQEDSMYLAQACVAVSKPKKRQ